jgi:choice-of-anchor B domain-containing protein
MKIFFLTFITAVFFQSLAQNNVTFLSNLNEYSSAQYNDVWGYVDGSGNEYALLGVRTGTSIVNVTNPQNPVEIAFIPGTNSIWRDIKTHSTYAYVVSDATSDGLQIIDLSQLPVTATLVNQINTWFDRAHNIFIDDGFAYAIGTESGGGMHILDLSNPTNPSRTAYYTGSGYIHDVFVFDDTVVACAEDVYDLVDVSNKNSPQLISRSIAIPNIYAHSGWMTDDRRYFFGTEEFNEVDITVWDLQDRSTWDLAVSSWETSSNATVHNLFILGNYAHISYYSDGYVVLDISDPENPVLDGFYDTSSMWGCYPYLPSGNTICSDINQGLYVLHFDGIVPVELNSFTAVANNQNVILNWSTATETNHLGFEIQKKDGNWFHTIGFVEGNGTTTEIKNYSYTDQSLQTGTYYYRLKQVDFDGGSEYSEEVMAEVTNPSKFVLDQNYPNPFNPSTKIKFSIPNSEFVNLSIYNLVGEKVADLVNESLTAGEYEKEFNAAGLSSGIYIAKISAGNFNQAIKISLMK